MNRRGASSRSNETATEYLTLDSLMQIAARAIGGEVLVRDYGLLESALARPRTTVFGEHAYPTLHRKAAALMHSSISNHALVDGNKRLGLLTTAVFLRLNGHVLEAADDDLFDMVMSIAGGSLTEIEQVEQRLVAYTVPAHD